MKITMFLIGVGCILYALYEGKPKDGGSGYTHEHGGAFVIGVLLILFSFA